VGLAKLKSRDYDNPTANSNIHT